MAAVATVGVIAADALMFVALLVGGISFGAKWTDYEVKVGHVKTFANSSKQLRQLYRVWPQLFYTRERLLREMCFMNMDDDTWLRMFGKMPSGYREHSMPGYCYTWQWVEDDDEYGGGGYEKVHERCHCLSIDEYNSPVHGAVPSPGYPTSSDLNTQKQQSSLHASYALLIVSIVLGIVSVIYITIAVHMVPEMARELFRILCGAIGIIIFLIVDSCVIAVVAMTREADQLEELIEQPPHYGFVLNTPELSAVTTRYPQSHGFRLVCAMLAFTILATVVSVLSLCLAMVVGRESSRDLWSRPPAGRSYAAKYESKSVELQCVPPAAAAEPAAVLLPPAAAEAEKTTSVDVEADVENANLKDETNREAARSLE